MANGVSGGVSISGLFAGVFLGFVLTQLERCWEFCFWPWIGLIIEKFCKLELFLINFTLSMLGGNPTSSIFFWPVHLILLIVLIILNFFPVDLYVAHDHQLNSESWLLSLKTHAMQTLTHREKSCEKTKHRSKHFGEKHFEQFLPFTCRVPCTCIYLTRNGETKHIGMKSWMGFKNKSV